MKVQNTNTPRKRYVPDLVADMAECDANYIRLLKLFPQLPREDGVEFGVQGTTEDGVKVTISIKERCPYTTMLDVKVAAEQQHSWVKWPVLEVRIYHDLKTAEVVSFERHGNFQYRYQTVNENLFQADEKSQINKFFGELLTFCLHHGHTLATVDLKCW